MKPGDRVVCVNSEETVQLREGREYTIDSIKWHRLNGYKSRPGKFVHLKEHSDPLLAHVFYHVSHFKKIREKV